MRRFRPLLAHLTYANVVATLALFAVLGTSGAYAAKLIDGHLIKPGTVRTAQLHKGAVTSSKLAPGAVTAKSLAAGLSLTGPAGAAGAAGPAGPKGDKGDKGDTGTVDTSDFYTKAASDARFVRLDHVKLLGGGTATENGAALLAAMAAIGTPSGPSDAWLLKLQPGVYDLGLDTLQLSAYVDLEGSGVNTTTVTSDNITLAAASHSEARDLTVRATTGDDGGAMAVSVPPGVTGFSFRHAAAVAEEEATATVTVIAMAVGGSADLDGVAVTATGSNAHVTAIFDYGSLSLRNSTVNASVTSGDATGLTTRSGGSLVSINNIVKASTLAVAGLNASNPVRVVNSQLDAPQTVSGTATCLGSWKGDYTPTSATCS